MISHCLLFIIRRREPLMAIYFLVCGILATGVALHAAQAFYLSQPNVASYACYDPIPTGMEADAYRQSICKGHDVPGDASQLIIVVLDGFLFTHLGLAVKPGLKALVRTPLEFEEV